jgi:uncharacterized 2Fe-2S/4Fe-4S cluster protein (DUF4445 family)
MKYYTITFKPDGSKVSIRGGATILEAAGRAGIILNTICGGKGTCGKCRVELEADGRKVLACRHRIESKLEVLIPPQAKFFEPRMLAHGIDRGITIGPAIRKRFGQFVDPAPGMFGVALDIGTTTVVAKLINLTDGSCRATAGAANPQIAYGDDVISRISYAESEAGLDKLHTAVIECVNSVIVQLCEQVDITPSDICEVVAVGNTTMNHLFLKFPVKQLGQAPYKAHSVKAHDLDAQKLKLNINPAGNIHTVENIKSFVGSDTTAVAVAVGMDEAEKMTLVVDIGTNGELILGTKDKMYATSCAAGPAFEGARISQGTMAIDGAIERVAMAGNDIDLDVIGGGAPRSICGSGLIDAVAVLLDLGIVDSSGRFIEPDKSKAKIPQARLARLIKQARQRAFILAHNEDNDNDPVVLSQQDLRETQLAKAAIRAGIKLLQKKAGITDNDIEQIFLAGAFGNYIQRESAVRIGLLPDVGVEKIRFAGNAAAVGAQMILLSSRCRRLCAELTKRIEYVETAREPEFQTIFAESLMFDG